MKPIRLKKDNVVHTVHSGVDRVRLATGADVARTAANPTQFGWPCCWVCTEKRMAEKRDGKLVGTSQQFGEQVWIPVEAYGIRDKRAKPDGNDEEDLEAQCTHGTGRVYTEVKILTMPRTWSEEKKRHKRASLVFFVGSSAEPIIGNTVLA